MTYIPDHKVRYIVIHYSATAIERDYTAADIDDMHRRRGFKEGGYHYFIRKDGTVEAGRDLTKPGRFEQGAHSKGENDESIGICYEGGVRITAPNVGFDSRTPKQLQAMELLIKELLKTRFSGAIVKGHRDMPGAATQCPGFDATRWWDSVVARVPERSLVLETVQADTAPRTSIWQSTTIRAQLTQWASTSGAAALALWSTQDDTTRLILAGLGAVAILAGAWIFKERIRKWIEGDR